MTLAEDRPIPAATLGYAFARRRGAMIVTGGERPVCLHRRSATLETLLEVRRVAGTDHCLVARTRELAPDLARTTQLAALAVNSGCELLPPQYDTAGKWGRLDLSKALRAIRLPTVPVTA